MRSAVRYAVYVFHHCGGFSGWCWFSPRMSCFILAQTCSLSRLYILICAAQQAMHANVLNVLCECLQYYCQRWDDDDIVESVLHDIKFNQTIIIICEQTRPVSWASMLSSPIAVAKSICHNVRNENHTMLSRLPETIRLLFLCAAHREKRKSYLHTFELLERRWTAQHCDRTSNLIHFLYSRRTLSLWLCAFAFDIARSRPCRIGSLRIITQKELGKSFMLFKDWYVQKYSRFFARFVFVFHLLCLLLLLLRIISASLLIHCTQHNMIKCMKYSYGICQSVHSCARCTDPYARVFRAIDALRARAAPRFCTILRCFHFWWSRAQYQRACLPSPSLEREEQDETTMLGEKNIEPFYNVEAVFETFRERCRWWCCCCSITL